MEKEREEELRFLVRSRVTEEKMLHLEKGIRIQGFQSGGRKLLTGFLTAAAAGLAGGFLMDGMAGTILTAVGAVLLLVFTAGVYSIFKAWHDAKKNIHLRCQVEKNELDHGWEYRFYDDCYEADGRYEKARISYSNLGRILEFTGMLVLVEKGNTIRYFTEPDMEKGTLGELKAFLERKSGTNAEFVSVR